LEIPHLGALLFVQDGDLNLVLGRWHWTWPWQDDAASEDPAMWRQRVVADVPTAIGKGNVTVESSSIERNFLSEPLKIRF
jgi:hypothetical protein